MRRILFAPGLLIIGLTCGCSGPGLESIESRYSSAERLLKSDELREAGV